MSDALINGVTGAGGGIIAQLITYPLQTVVQQEGWAVIQPIGTFVGWDRVFAALFAGILTMRPWNRVIDHAVNHLSIQGNASDHSELQALVLVDAKGIKENCMKLSAGEDLYALFAGILTTRPWNTVIDPAVDYLAIQV